MAGNCQATWYGSGGLGPAPTPAADEPAPGVTEVAALLMYIPGLDTLVITGERHAELPSAAAAPRIRVD